MTFEASAELRLGEMEMLRAFWDAALELDPDAPDFRRLGSPAGGFALTARAWAVSGSAGVGSVPAA